MIIRYLSFINTLFSISVSSVIYAGGETALTNLVGSAPLVFYLLWALLGVVMVILSGIDYKMKVLSYVMVFAPIYVLILRVPSPDILL